jgi:hypothetical protein
MSRDADFHGRSPVASDAAFRAAVADLLDRTPLHGDAGQARRRGDRLRRRRRTLLTGSALVVVLIATFAFVGRDDSAQTNRIEVLDGPTTIEPSPTPTAPSTTDPASVPPPPGAIEGLAVGRNGGEIWLVRSDIGAVQRHRVDNGRVAEQLSSFVLPGLDRVVVGADAVWAFGNSDATGGGEICVIDPTSGQPIDGHAGDGTIAPRGIAFAGGATWITDTANDRVMRVQLVGDRLQTQPVAVGDEPREIVATGNGELWVREAGDGTIARIDTERLVVAQRHTWTGALFAPDGADAIWAADGGRVVSLTPSALAVGQSVALGARLDADATAVAVANNVIWVATRDNRLLRYEQVGTSGSPRLTASTSVDGTVTAISPDGAALWYSTSRLTTVARWAP